MSNQPPNRDIPLNMFRDLCGNSAYSPLAPYRIFGVQLAANTEQHFTIPGTYQQWVIFFAIDPGLRLFVAYNHTATVYTGTIGAVTSELNPQARTVNAGDVISLISPDALTYVGISCYGLPNSL